MKKHILNSAKMGEVWAVSLSSSQFGYIHIMRGASLGVFPVVSNGVIRDPEELKSISARWFFSFVAPPDEKTKMLLVGTIPFANDAASWPPPRFIPPDIFQRDFRIVEKGFQRPAKGNEAEGLQQARVASPDWLRRFILEHRAECCLIEGEYKKEVEAEIHCDAPPYLLEVVFKNVDFPPHRRDSVEDSLGDILEKSGKGEVTGGGVGPETSSIDIEVTELGPGLKIVRETLLQLHCPKSTEIHQSHPTNVVHHLGEL